MVSKWYLKYESERLLEATTRSTSERTLFESTRFAESCANYLTEIFAFFNEKLVFFSVWSPYTIREFSFGFFLKKCKFSCSLRFCQFWHYFMKKYKKQQKSSKNQHFDKIVLKENVCIFSKVTWIKVCCFYSMFSNLLIFHVETTLDWCVDTDLWKKHHCWQGATFHVLFTSRIWKLEQFGTIPHPISQSLKMYNFPQSFLHWKSSQQNRAHAFMGSDSRNLSHALFLQAFEVPKSGRFFKSDH